MLFKTVSGSLWHFEDRRPTIRNIFLTCSRFSRKDISLGHSQEETPPLKALASPIMGGSTLVSCSFQPLIQAAIRGQGEEHQLNSLEKSEVFFELIILEYSSFSRNEVKLYNFAFFSQIDPLEFSWWW